VSRISAELYTNHLPFTPDVALRFCTYQQTPHWSFSFLD